MRTAERVALVLSGIALGLALGTTSSLTWNSELNLSDVLNFIATVVVAVFVADFVRRRSESTLGERQLLISHLQGAIDLVKEVRQLFSKSLHGQPLTPNEFQDIVWTLRQANNTLYLVQEVSEAGTLDKAAKDRLRKCVTALADYKATVTNGELPSFPSGTLMKNRHDNALRTLLLELSLAIFAINKSTG